MRNDVLVRLVRSDGQKFEIDGIGERSGWFAPPGSIKRFAEFDQTVRTTPNVLTDGAMVVSKRLEPMDRELSAAYRGEDPNSARLRAMSFFNPKFTFEAHVTYRGETRWCEGEIPDFKSEIEAEGTPPRITFTLLCPDPYMRAEDGNEAAFGDSVPGLGFPFVSHVREVLPNGERYPVGFIVSRRIYDGLNSVHNTGDVECMYKVRIEADGELQNPTITKDGRFVRLLTTLHDGDVALIDFEASPPNVTVNGENAIQLCSRDSSFTGMQMGVGRNQFAFTVDNPGNRSLARVQVLFHARHLGV